MKSPTRKAVIALAILLFTSCGGGGSAPAPPQLNWQIKDSCDDKLPIFLYFYGTLSGFSPVYQAVIWQPDQYQVMTVTCKSVEERICLGADNGKRYQWGVGANGDKSCAWECCFPCDGSTHQHNLVCD